MLNTRSAMLNLSSCILPASCNPRAAASLFFNINGQVSRHPPSPGVMMPPVIPRMHLFGHAAPLRSCSSFSPFLFPTFYHFQRVSGFLRVVFVSFFLPTSFLFLFWGRTQRRVNLIFAVLSECLTPFYRIHAFNSTDGFFSISGFL